jgi:hypothetical protein
MADHDPAGIRPVTDPRFLQRYALVTFYHATNGDKWRFCNPTNICRGPWKAFTSAFDECEWMGVVCNNEGMIEKIKIGTSSVFVYNICEIIDGCSMLLNPLYIFHVALLMYNC